MSLEPIRTSDEAGGWVELRVHGVSGTPPEELLGVPHVRQVAGDDYSRFFRPVDGERRPRPRGLPLGPLHLRLLAPGPRPAAGPLRARQRGPVHAARPRHLVRQGDAPRRGDVPAGPGARPDGALLVHARTDPHRHRRLALGARHQPVRGRAVHPGRPRRSPRRGAGRRRARAARALGRHAHPAGSRSRRDPVQHGPGSGLLRRRPERPDHARAARGRRSRRDRAAAGPDEAGRGGDARVAAVPRRRPRRRDAGGDRRRRPGAHGHGGLQRGHRRRLEGPPPPLRPGAARALGDPAGRGGVADRPRAARPPLRGGSPDRPLGLRPRRERPHARGRAGAGPAPHGEPVPRLAGRGARRLDPPRRGGPPGRARARARRRPARAAGQHGAVADGARDRRRRVHPRTRGRSPYGARSRPAARGRRPTSTTSVPSPAA